jgi:hypothetical protein
VSQSASGLWQSTSKRKWKAKKKTLLKGSEQIGQTSLDSNFDSFGVNAISNAIAN